MDCGVRAVDIG